MQLLKLSQKLFVSVRKLLVRTYEAKQEFITRLDWSNLACMALRFFKVQLSDIYWQSQRNAYNCHSLVHYTIFVPQTDHWKLSSKQSLVRDTSLLVLQSDEPMLNENIGFSSVDDLTGRTAPWQLNSDRKQQLCRSSKKNHKLHSQEWKIFVESLILAQDERWRRA